MKNVEFRHLKESLQADILIIPVLKEGKTPMFEIINAALEKGAEAGMEQFSYQSSFGELCLLTTNGKYPVPRLLFIGIEGGSALEIQCLAGKIAPYISDAGRVAIEGEHHYSHYLLLGLLLRTLGMPSYKTLAPEKKQAWIQLSSHPEKSASDFGPFLQLYESVALARSLTAAPANRLNPQQFAKKCSALAELGLAIEVLDRTALENEGFHALLAVGKGSSNPPYVVTLRWNGGSGDPIAFVGKGVCFDAGGINIKTEELHMMKWDKAGAAAVVGLMRHLAAAKAKVNAIGIVGLVENMVDGSSFKPGDIIDTHSGLTVEVVDTDNEGRLVLCDCMSYVQKIAKPTILIDLATLTLETMGALADQYGGLYCNDQQLSAELIRAGEESGERLWPLPIGRGFAKQIESEEADIKNCGDFGYGEGGATAEFLRSFVKPGVKWAHLDIAGIAWVKEDQDCCPKGVTGFGVQLLQQFLENGHFN